MSILGKAFDLPTTDASKIVIDNVVLPRIMAFDLPPMSDVANESLAKMAGTFDGAGPFSKPNSGSQSFEEYKAGRAGINVVGNKVEYTPTTLTADQVNSFAPEENVSAQTIKQQTGSPTTGKEHMVRLTEKSPSGEDGYTMYFDVMPEIVEARNVSYEAVSPPQFPGAFQKYKGTDSVQWTLNVTLISRTTSEASKNLENINILRSWTQPYYGEVTAQAYPEKLGAPPPILILEGFKAKIVGPVPVVITSLNWNWPRDVDYIPAASDDGQLIPFPVVIQVAIQCVESLSTQEFNNFNLADYRAGNFSTAFSKTPSEMMVSNPQQGTAGEDEEPQKISAGAGRGFINPALVSPSAGAGRGFVNPALVSPSAGGGRGFVNPSTVTNPDNASSSKSQLQIINSNQA